MACLTPPNNIVQVDIQLIFEMVNTFCINSCLWKSIPIVNHSLCEEIVFTIMVGTWTFFSKCFNLNKIYFYQIELNGQIKIRLHLSKSINPVQIYFNLKVLQNLTLKWVKNTGKTVIE